MKKIGIYCIKCLINNKVYIGKSVNIYSRKQKHFNSLKNNKHSNRHLQSAFNSYGIDSFSFDIIELCDVADIDERESYYIRLFKATDHDCGFNIKMESDGVSSHSADTVELMKTLKSDQSKEVYAYTIDGEFVNHWTSISSCAKDLLVNPCDVRRTILQKQRLCRGLVLNSEPVFRLRPSGRLGNYKNLEKHIESINAKKVDSNNYVLI